MEFSSDDKETDRPPSSYPEFAHCFSFFQLFGNYLCLPEVTLLSLEAFFTKDFIHSEDPITIIHYQLLCFVTRRPVTMDNWMMVAAKLACTTGNIKETSDYEDYDLEQRLKLCKFLCDIQFDRNSSLKSYLAKIPEEDPCWRESPVGIDKEGSRYWILQDSLFDIRLYSEHKYLEYPFDHPQWTLKCSSLDELISFVDEMKSPDKQFNEGAESPKDEDIQSSDSGGHKKRKIPGRKSKEKKIKKGGCMVCRKDTCYSKMLLCDLCDNEYHTFCQYPIVWKIPDEEWFCPVCREIKLIKRFEEIYTNLRKSKILYEETLEEEQKKLKRLARGGVLVQNIINEQEIDEAAPRRSARARKKIDYAELNEVNIYLPSKRTLSYTYPVTYNTRRSTRHFVDTTESDSSLTEKSESSLNSKEPQETCIMTIETVRSTTDEVSDDCRDQDPDINFENGSDVVGIDTQTKSLLCSFPLDSVSCTKSMTSSQMQSPPHHSSLIQTYSSLPPTCDLSTVQSSTVTSNSQQTSVLQSSQSSTETQSSTILDVPVNHSEYNSGLQLQGSNLFVSSSNNDTSAGLDYIKQLKLDIKATPEVSQNRKHSSTSSSIYEANTRLHFE